MSVSGSHRAGVFELLAAFRFSLIPYIVKALRFKMGAITQSYNYVWYLSGC